METKKLLTCCDLMIGDWVNIYKFTNEEQQIKDLFPAKVVSILQGNEKENYNTIECVYGTKIASRPADTCLPIPLTAEILEKNGFSELMEHDEWSRIFRVYHDDLFIEVGIYEPMFINIGYVDNEGEEQPLSDIVKVHGENFYVHELQHAMRLCGVDTEIVL